MTHTARRLAAAVTTACLIASGVIAGSIAQPGAILALPGASESTIVTVANTRVLDSRAGTEVGLSGRFVAGTSRILQITGPINTYVEATNTRTNKQVVPPGATGVVMNVTAVLPTAQGVLSIRPGDATGAPSTSSINLLAGQIVPNAVTVALTDSGPNAGQINITYFGAAPSNTVDVLIDIVAYTTSSGLVDMTNRLIRLENKDITGLDILDETIETYDIKDNTIGSADIADGSLSGDDINDNTIESANIRDYTLGRVDLDDDIRPRFIRAQASSTGVTILAESGTFTIFLPPERRSTGVYGPIAFDRDVTNCAWTGTVFDNGNGDAAGYDILITRSTNSELLLDVSIFNANGTAVDLTDSDGFSVTVTC